MTDRISDLPDELLCHTLSFLPLKHAVATSILSKRWKPLWLSLPTIDFFHGHDTPYWTPFEEQARNSTQFVKFVDSVMTSRDVQRMKRFRLRCYLFTKSHKIVAWVDTAIQLRVEELEIFLGNPSIRLLPNIFTSKTLVVLRLRCYHALIDVSSVYLPSLKFLNLEGVRFSDKECVSRFLCGCTILEDLVVKNVIIESSSSQGSVYEYSFTKLAKVHIHGSKFLPLRALYNVEFLYLYQDMHVLQDTPTFQNLVHLELLSCCYMNWKFVVKILKNSPKLETLVVEEIDNTRKEEEHPEWGDPSYSLEGCLTKLRTFKSKGCDHSDSINLDFVCYVLKNATMLQSVTLYSHLFSNADLKFMTLQTLSSSPTSATIQLLPENKKRPCLLNFQFLNEYILNIEMR